MGRQYTGGEPQGAARDIRGLGTDGMKRAHTGPVFALALCALALSGCHKVKPVVLLPQQPPASTHTEPPADQSQPATATPAETQEQPSTPKPGDATASANTPPGKSGKSKSKHHAGTAQKPAPQPSVPATNSNGKPAAEVAKNTPPSKITILEGGADSRAGSGQI